MTYTLGIDISKYQGAMDFAKAKAAGAQFAFIRAGGAYQNSPYATYTDSRWPENLAAVQAAGLPWSPYWYFSPGNVEAQAEKYLELVAFADWYMPPAVDCEYNAGLTVASYCNALEDFLTRLDAELIDKPIIYTRGSWWNTNTVSRAIWPTHDLWIARYTAKSHPWSDNPSLYKPRDWSDFRFWQWSADGNGRAAEFGCTGGDDDIDLDYFNGDLNALYQYLGTSQPIIYPYIVRVTGPDGCIVRAQPNGSTLLRVEPNGAHLGILGAAEDVDGAVWLDTGQGYVRETAVTKI